MSGAFQTLYVEHRPDLDVCKAIEDIIEAGGHFELAPEVVLSSIVGYVCGYRAGDKAQNGQAIAGTVQAEKSNNSATRPATLGRSGR